jgi:hypothetical protein
MSDSNSTAPSAMQWIPGHCVYSPHIKTQLSNCPTNYTWRKGHYRQVTPRQEEKYMKRVRRKVRTVLAKHPTLCGPFQDLEAFQNCLLLVRKSLQSFLLKNPTRTQVRQYTDHLVNRVIYCTGKRLQAQCYFKPNNEVRQFIENRMKKYVDAYLQN